MEKHVLYYPVLKINLNLDSSNNKGILDFGRQNLIDAIDFFKEKIIDNSGCIEDYEKNHYRVIKAKNQAEYVSRNQFSIKFFNGKNSKLLKIMGDEKNRNPTKVNGKKLDKNGDFLYPGSKIIVSNVVLIYKILNNENSFFYNKNEAVMDVPIIDYFSFDENI